MECISLFFSVILVSAVCSLPVEKTENVSELEITTQHNIEKRFVNPMFSSWSVVDDDLIKMRTKRSEDDCEKLQLCKLHARANRNFLSAFQLYFVNKENARLWDHQAHSNADCEQRFGGCY